ncbi:hypothetical protein [Campylobacter troglodytis]|nr:hypothetical protein [Campylobacter troglodytis]
MRDNFWGCVALSERSGLVARKRCEKQTPQKVSARQAVTTTKDKK